MDKNAIKKYAIWARRELIARVSQRAAMYEITAEGYGDADAVSVHGRILTLEEKNQRRALIEKIKEKGYEQVMEEVAYTWFNRFSALRFMEVNGYLPSHVRVFTDDENNFKPQIMTEAINLEMDGLDMQKIYAFKTANDDDGLFKYLIISQCNALFSILPGMFQQISDYTELLFPDNLLREGSVVEQMISMIPEEDWTDQVQIIGWLYQYYNTEPKDQVFANLKKNIKISKENIPAATQLFTPDWIVRYMVENSLGRLWIEGHPNDELKTSWKYFLDEAEQEENIEKQLKKIRKEYAQLKPEDIRCIDPCMGSGHILVYMFDVLVQIYEAYGYSAREAATSIIKNNIWGLDIDERAAQLAYFSVMMKARQYDRRFFSRGIQPHVYAIQESNVASGFHQQNKGEFQYFKERLETLDYLLNVFMDAREYGSILQIEDKDYVGLRKVLIESHTSSLNDYSLSLWQTEVVSQILPLIEQAITLSQTYHVVVTNPPYMGGSGMSSKLANYVKNNYPDTKSDMSTVFMERTLNLCSRTGFMAMINIPVWMFLSSYEKLRNNIINKNTIINMLHFGRGVFGSDFGTTAFVISKMHIAFYNARYKKLYEKQGSVDSLESKRLWFFKQKGEYYETQESYLEIPGIPIAYSLGKRLLSAYATKRLVSTLGDVKQGLATGDNNRFLRLWPEVNLNKIFFDAKNSKEALKSRKKWFPYNKGGAYRKWFGNVEYVVNWENDGFEIKNIRDEKGKLRSRPQNLQYFFKESLTWSKVTIGGFSMRYVPTGTIFDVAGCSLFPNSSYMELLANLNSCVQSHILSVFSQSVNYEVGQIAALPMIDLGDKAKRINELASSCVSLSKEDWDSFETSWNFQSHPLVPLALERKEQLVAGTHSKERWESVSLLNNRFTCWREKCSNRFNFLKQNEEEMNRLFIDIYSLKDELVPNVADKDVTVRQADLQRDVCSLISYAIGCMFGRYSLDQPGLILAGQDFKEKFVYSNVPLSGTGFSGMPSLVSGKRVCYLKRDNNDFVRCTFEPDEDAIIPICDDEYFNDDIVSRFVEFVKVVYGKETLEENLQFIANALGGSGTSREIIRNYFINSFYADHLKVYQKRPIYWLFDSGKKNGFKCLVYMHRYQPDTIARIRTDYVHEQQSRYRTAIADLQNRIDNAATTSERVKLSKKLKTVQEQDEELRIYEEKIHHLADQMIKIDLDDGVKVNYAKFQDVLAKIK